MFYLNELSNLDIGVIPVEDTFLGRASVAFEEIIIDGKDGADLIESSYNNLTGSLELQVIKKEELDNILQIFNGKKKLKYNNRTCDIYFYDAVEIKRLGNSKTLTVNFIRSPFWESVYFKAVELKQADISIKFLVGGNTTCYPFLVIKGKGVCDISINDIRFIINFDEDGIKNNKVEINCLDKTEKLGNVNLSKIVEIGFDYPKFESGMDNSIVINDGNDVEITAQYKEKWL